MAKSKYHDPDYKTVGHILDKTACLTEMLEKVRIIKQIAYEDHNNNNPEVSFDGIFLLARELELDTLSFIEALADISNDIEKQLENDYDQPIKFVVRGK